MRIDDYFSLTGLSPALDPQLFEALAKKYPHDPRFGCYDDLLTQYTWSPTNEGKLVLGAFAYSTMVPELGIPWNIACTRMWGLGDLRAILPHIRRFCRGASKVLEAGCGDGNILGWIAAHTRPGTVIGCDVAPEALTLARLRLKRAGIAGITLVRADMRDIGDFCPAAFDRIIVRNAVGGEPFLLRARNEHQCWLADHFAGLLRALTTHGRILYAETPPADYRAWYTEHFRGAIALAGGRTIRVRSIREPGSSDAADRCLAIEWGRQSSRKTGVLRRAAGKSPTH